MHMTVPSSDVRAVCVVDYPQQLGGGPYLGSLYVTTDGDPDCPCAVTQNGNRMTSVEYSSLGIRKTCLADVTQATNSTAFEFVPNIADGEIRTVQVRSLWFGGTSMPAQSEATLQYNTTNLAKFDNVAQDPNAPFAMITESVSLIDVPNIGPVSFLPAPPTQDVLNTRDVQIGPLQITLRGANPNPDIYACIHTMANASDNSERALVMADPCGCGDDMRIIAPTGFMVGPTARAAMASRDTDVSLLTTCMPHGGDAHVGPTSELRFSAVSPSLALPGYDINVRIEPFGGEPFEFGFDIVCPAIGDCTCGVSGTPAEQKAQNCADIIDSSKLASVKYASYIASGGADVLIRFQPGSSPPVIEIICPDVDLRLVSSSTRMQSPSSYWELSEVEGDAGSSPVIHHVEIGTDDWTPLVGFEYSAVEWPNHPTTVPSNGRLFAQYPATMLIENVDCQGSTVTGMGGDSKMTQLQAGGLTCGLTAAGVLDYKGIRHSALEMCQVWVSRNGQDAGADSPETCSAASAADSITVPDGTSYGKFFVRWRMGSTYSHRSEEIVVAWRPGVPRMEISIQHRGNRALQLPDGPKASLADDDLLEVQTIFDNQRFLKDDDTILVHPKHETDPDTTYTCVRVQAEKGTDPSDPGENPFTPMCVAQFTAGQESGCVAGSIEVNATTGPYPIRAGGSNEPVVVTAQQCDAMAASPGGVNGDSSTEVRYQGFCDLCMMYTKPPVATTNTLAFKLTDYGRSGDEYELQFSIHGDCTTPATCASIMQHAFDHAVATSENTGGNTPMDQLWAYRTDTAAGAVKFVAVDDGATDPHIKITFIRVDSTGDPWRIQMAASTALEVVRLFNADAPSDDVARASLIDASINNSTGGELPDLSAFVSGVGQGFRPHNFRDEHFNHQKSCDPDAPASTVALASDTQPLNYPGGMFPGDVMTFGSGCISTISFNAKSPKPSVRVVSAIDITSAGGAGRITEEHDGAFINDGTSRLLVDAALVVDSVNDVSGRNFGKRANRVCYSLDTAMTGADAMMGATRQGITCEDTIASSPTFVDLNDKGLTYVCVMFCMSGQVQQEENQHEPYCSEQACSKIGSANKPASDYTTGGVLDFFGHSGGFGDKSYPMRCGQHDIEMTVDTFATPSSKFGDPNDPSTSQVQKITTTVYLPTATRDTRTELSDDQHDHANGFELYTYNIAPADAVDNWMYAPNSVCESPSGGNSNVHVAATLEDGIAWGKSNSGTDIAMFDITPQPNSIVSGITSQSGVDRDITTLTGASMVPHDFTGAAEDLWLRVTKTTGSGGDCAPTTNHTDIAVRMDSDACDDLSKLDSCRGVIQDILQGFSYEATVSPAAGGSAMEMAFLDVSHVTLLAKSGANALRLFGEPSAEVRVRRCAYDRSVMEEDSRENINVLHSDPRHLQVFRVKTCDASISSGSMTFRNQQEIDADEYRAFSSQTEATLSSARQVDIFEPITRPSGGGLACVRLAEDSAERMVVSRGSTYPTGLFDLNSACSGDHTKAACRTHPGVQVLQADVGVNRCMGQSDWAPAGPKSRASGFVGGRGCSGEQCDSARSMCDQGQGVIGVVAAASVEGAGGIQGSLGGGGELVKSQSDIGNAPEWEFNDAEFLNGCVAITQTAAVPDDAGPADYERFHCSMNMNDDFGSGAVFTQAIGSCNVFNHYTVKHEMVLMLQPPSATAFEPGEKERIFESLRPNLELAYAAQIDITTRVATSGTLKGVEAMPAFPAGLNFASSHRTMALMVDGILHQATLTRACTFAINCMQALQHAISTTGAAGSVQVSATVSGMLVMKSATSQVSLETARSSPDVLALFGAQGFNTMIAGRSAVEGVGFQAFDFASAHCLVTLDVDLDSERQATLMMDCSSLAAAACISLMNGALRPAGVTASVFTESDEDRFMLTSLTTGQDSKVVLSGVQHQSVGPFKALFGTGNLDPTAADGVNAADGRFALEPGCSVTATFEAATSKCVFETTVDAITRGSLPPEIHTTSLSSQLEAKDAYVAIMNRLDEISNKNEAPFDEVLLDDTTTSVDMAAVVMSLDGNSDGELNGLGNPVQATVTSTGAVAYDAVPVNRANMDSRLLCPNGGIFGVVVTAWRSTPEVPAGTRNAYLIEADSIPEYNTHNAAAGYYKYQPAVMGRSAFVTSSGEAKGPATSILMYTHEVSGSDKARLRVQGGHSRVHMMATTCAVDSQSSGIADTAGNGRAAGEIMPSWVRHELIEKSQPIGEPTYRIETVAVCSDDHSKACNLTSMHEPRNDAACGYHIDAHATIHSKDMDHSKRCGVRRISLEQTMTMDLLYGVPNTGNSNPSKFMSFIGDKTVGNPTAFQSADVARSLIPGFAVTVTESAGGQGTPAGSSRVITFHTASFPFVSSGEMDHTQGKMAFAHPSGSAESAVLGHQPMCTADHGKVLSMSSSVTSDNIVRSSVAFETTLEKTERSFTLVDVVTKREMNVDPTAGDACIYTAHTANKEVLVRSGRKDCAMGVMGLDVKLLASSTSACISYGQTVMATANLEFDSAVAAVEFPTNQAAAICTLIAIESASSSYARNVGYFSPECDVIEGLSSQNRCGNKAIALMSETGQCVMRSEQHVLLVLTAAQADARCYQLEDVKIDSLDISAVTTRVCAAGYELSADDCIGHPGHGADGRRAVPGDEDCHSTGLSFSAQTPMSMTVHKCGNFSNSTKQLPITIYNNVASGTVLDIHAVLKPASGSVESTGVVSAYEVSVFQDNSWVSPRIRPVRGTGDVAMTEANLNAIGLYETMACGGHYPQVVHESPQYFSRLAPNCSLSTRNSALCGCMAAHDDLAAATGEATLHMYSNASASRGKPMHCYNQPGTAAVLGDTEIPSKNTAGLMVSSSAFPLEAGMSVPATTAFLWSHIETLVRERGNLDGSGPEIETALVYACLTPRNGGDRSDDGGASTTYGAEYYSNASAMAAADRRIQLCPRAGDTLVYLHYGDKDAHEFMTAEGNYATPGCTAERRQASQVANYGQSDDAGFVFDMSNTFTDSMISTTDADADGSTCSAARQTGNFDFCDEVVQLKHPGHANSQCRKAAAGTAADAAYADLVANSTHHHAMYSQAKLDRLMEQQANALGVTETRKYITYICERFMDPTSALSVCTLSMDLKLVGQFAKTVEINTLQVVRARIETDTGARRSAGSVLPAAEIRRVSRQFDVPDAAVSSTQAGTSRREGEAATDPASVAQAVVTSIPECATVPGAVNPFDVEHASDNSETAFGMLFCAAIACPPGRDIAISTADQLGLTMSMQCTTPTAISDADVREIRDDADRQTTIAWIALLAALVGLTLVIMILAYFGYLQWLTTRVEAAAVEATTIIESHSKSISNML